MSYEFIYQQLYYFITNCTLSRCEKPKAKLSQAEKIRILNTVFANIFLDIFL